MKKALFLLLPCLTAMAAPLTEEGRIKNQEDPTKIVSRLGAGYDGSLTINGSIGLDEARMITGYVNSDASEWRVGGSWLFDTGIVNFNFKRNQYDDGGESTSYNLGTFIPLSVFGIEPAGWQIFPTFGYNYTDGEVVIGSDWESNPILMPIDSHGGYVGAFGLKPLSGGWTLMLAGGGSMGSNDTNNAYGGAGVSYRMSNNQSVNGFVLLSDSNQFGRKETYSMSYRYEFN
jgi:hypothetical protein